MGKAKVYFTKEITPEAMVRMYEAMGVELPGKVAVKLHSGEVGNQNFLRPDLMKPVIDRAPLLPLLPPQATRASVRAKARNNAHNFFMFSISNLFVFPCGMRSVYRFLFRLSIICTYFQKFLFG